MTAVLHQIVRLMVAISAVVCAVGCASKPEMAPREVLVTLDERLRDAQGRMPPIQVDIIAVNDSEKPRWESMLIDNYWKPGNEFRASASKYEMAFQPADRFKALPAFDGHWAQWEAKGAMHLFVIAFIPGLRGGGEGERDPRRVILPLDKHRWADLSTIRILAEGNGISATTSALPEQKR